MTDQSNLVDALRAAGFQGQALVTATAIGLAETGGTASPGATNPGTAAVPEYSVGPLQINLQAHGTQISEAQARDPRTAAQYAYKLSGGGANFSPWSTYLGGQYRAWLDEAQQLVNGSGQPPAAATSTTTPINWIPGGDALASAVAPVGAFFAWFTPANVWKATLTVAGVSLVVGGAVLYFGGDQAAAAAHEAVRAV